MASPLLTVRCPEDLMSRLKRDAGRSGLSKLVIDRLESGLSSMPLAERKNLPSVACVYLVQSSDGKLLYIGQTQDLRKRWENHHRLGALLSIDSHCRVGWLDVDDRLEVEETLIHALTPELNRITSESPRDKQLVIRMTESDRERFKEFCKANGLEMTGFLYQLICRFVDGSLTLEHIKQPTASDINSDAIAELKKELAGMIKKEVETAIAGVELPRVDTAIESLTRADIPNNVSEDDTTVSMTAIAGQTELNPDTVTPVKTTEVSETVSPSKTEVRGETVSPPKTISPSDVPGWLDAGREYTQQDFVELTGAGRTMISNVLNGKKDTNNSDLKKLAILKANNRLIKQGARWIYIEN